jgi:cell division septation protein DedD
MAEYDDGAYYEVQLNNKQLVFFFMATLAIAVVVFLCGVMVGRGVRDATLAAVSNDIAAGTLTPSAEKTQPSTDKPEPKLDYPDRLETGSVQNKLESVKSESPETTLRKTRPKPAQPKPAPVRRAVTLGGSQGAFAVQVVALKTEDAARSLLSRLQNKNYRAYLEAGGEAGLHRVRVGRFSTRAEAEKVVQKLRDEERFKPYITQ